MTTISTHAPRTGSDNVPGECLTAQRLFQPTLPARGATLGQPVREPQRKQFQPTLPARGATNMVFPLTFTQSISTHAPRTGSDRTWRFSPSARAHFNPRSPHGERRQLPSKGGAIQYFNPRSPHGERPARMTTNYRQLNFNPRSPHGERRLMK